MEPKDGKDKPEKPEDEARQIKTLNQRVRELEAAVYLLENEKESLIESFQNSTNILIERIKTLEEQVHGQRPKTAQILNMEEEDRKSISVIPNGTEINNSFIFRKEALENDLVICHNCGRKFHKSVIKRHTIMCYRYLTPKELLLAYFSVETSSDARSVASTSQRPSLWTISKSGGM